jgi:2-polyprenyl-3-methyl-5-hydroxy-6-metoxy-1,4-benzoquinol methylase
MPERPHSVAGHLKLVQSAALWIDAIEVTGDIVTARGWTLNRGRGGLFRVNGERAAEQHWSTSPDRLPFDALPDSALVGSRFLIRHPVSGNVGTIRIEFCSEGEPDIISRDNAWYFVPDRAEKYPLPDDTNVSRVIVGNRYAYKVGGATTASRLDNYLRRVTGKGFAEAGTILDWGCGCARVLRYIGMMTPRVEGGDIDPFNVEWCKKNLPGHRFETLPLEPRTKYADNSFDVVIGISVMTHLREPMQDAWLRELSRIVRPGGYAMLSIMGPSTQLIGAMGEETLSATATKGFHITDEGNAQLDVSLEGAAYYINVTHAHWYIAKHWPQAAPWQVVDIAEGLAVAQDVVLLRNLKR